MIGDFANIMSTHTDTHSTHTHTHTQQQQHQNPVKLFLMRCKFVYKYAYLGRTLLGFSTASQVSTPNRILWPKQFWAP